MNRILGYRQHVFHKPDSYIYLQFSKVISKGIVMTANASGNNSNYREEDESNNQESGGTWSHLPVRLKSLWAQPKLVPLFRHRAYNMSVNLEVERERNRKYPMARFMFGLKAADSRHQYPQRFRMFLDYLL
ncbi:MAG TPA: hypothetical protein VE130_07875 [Nitrososphaeraceae archaeon]|nr:hypothetical protein [Nitrososphaeraceae archaeon]